MECRTLPTLGLIVWGLVLWLVASPAGVRAATEVELGLQGGYRQDVLDWNIAGNVDVLSDLQWRRLEIAQVQATASLRGSQVPWGGRWAARGLVGIGAILDGRNQDSDYAGDQRTLEFSRSNNDAGDGRVLDFSVAGGWEWSHGPGLRITPLLGYSRHEQRLVVRDGRQTLSRPELLPHAQLAPPGLGPILGLDSDYEARWEGPWVGCALDLPLSPDWQLTSLGELHWGDFEATADWNLRTDFAHPVSFRQTADSLGVVLEFAGHYRLNSRWTLHLAGNYAAWSTYPGLHRIYFADGRVGHTRLNEVNWTSYALQAGLQVRFP